MPQLPHTYKPGELVTIAHACTLTGVSRRTIYNWIACEKIQIVRVASGTIRIVKASLFQSSTDGQ